MLKSRPIAATIVPSRSRRDREPARAHGHRPTPIDATPSSCNVWCGPTELLLHGRPLSPWTVVVLVGAHRAAPGHRPAHPIRGVTPVHFARPPLPTAPTQLSSSRPLAGQHTRPRGRVPTARSRSRHSLRPEPTRPAAGPAWVTHPSPAPAPDPGQSLTRQCSGLAQALAADRHSLGYAV